MSEMLGNHYFLSRNFFFAEKTYEKLPVYHSSNPKVLKKLIICYTQTHKIAKALQYLLVLIAKDISTILENNRKDDDCPCNELILKIENDEIKYSTDEDKYTALAILWIYCNHKTSIYYFQMALNENPKSKNLIKIISFIKKLSKQNILQTNQNGVNMEHNVTRKDFLTKASKAVVGLTAVAGISSLVTTANTQAKTVVTPWPWPYAQLDTEAVRIQAHNLYWNDKDCCAGTFGAVVNALSTVVGDPWTNLPMEVMLYGRGGGNAWGMLCGCLNGGAALISLVTTKAQSGALINELWGWYSQAELPTDQANLVAVNGQYLVHNYDQTLPQNISGSALCHASVTEWCLVAGKKVSDIERKERCARITGDVAAKTAEILNAFFAGSFVSTYVDPAAVTACLSCHGTAVLNNVMTKMECTPCHSTAHGGLAVAPVGGIASSFALSQNYPNPFNPSTKIQFSVPQMEKVKVEIYDIQGSLIKTLVDYDLYQQGNYEVMWDGTDNNGKHVSSGIYFTKMQAGKFAQTKKMNLVK